jgi:hypothetical protein
MTDLCVPFLTSAIARRTDRTRDYQTQKIREDPRSGLLSPGIGSMSCPICGSRSTIVSPEGFSGCNLQLFSPETAGDGAKVFRCLL